MCCSYVCGGTKMAGDVRNALVELMAQPSQLNSRDAAVKKLADMQLKGRYLQVERRALQPFLAHLCTVDACQSSRLTRAATGCVELMVEASLDAWASLRSWQRLLVNMCDARAAGSVYLRGTVCGDHIRLRRQSKTSLWQGAGKEVGVRKLPVSASGVRKKTR